MTKRMKLPVYGFIGIIAATLILTGCIIHVGASDGKGAYTYTDGDDYTSTNKSVKVAKGLTVGEVSSVNGSLSLDDNVTAEEVSNVNGRIRIGDNVTVESVSIVNGSINIGEGFSASEDVSTVNGNINIEQNSNVGASITTVNGDVDLDNVTVAENIVTVNGDIALLNGTIVEGDVRFERKPQRNNRSNRPPTLKVDASSQIRGAIIIYDEVNFEFADPTLMDKVQRR
ncbi:hypothetical protein KJ365_13160 [Glaciecola sp. XM2]|uniref:hypothetical protein n=1 Tax=Glaciecola sp. XM2 TaxID=1914931 RepID=UPI001BDE739F|nr:hypothetical protein [Glaciecola sp. XM2]MBT1451835.1 hypothetical protein [Glaciecola sp. XM2]